MTPEQQIAIATTVDSILDATVLNEEWGELALDHNGPNSPRMMALSDLLENMTSILSETLCHAWECYHWQVACRRWKMDNYGVNTSLQSRETKVMELFAELFPEKIIAE